MQWQCKIKHCENHKRSHNYIDNKGTPNRMNWFAKINGQVYGPYSDQHMHGFVAEGRITAQSQISNAPASGFFDAISYDVFSFWSGSGQMVQNGEPFSAPQSYSYDALGAHALGASPQNPMTMSGEQPLGAANAQSSVFVIMAEIRSNDGAAFVSAMSSFGHSERIGDSVWLLKTASSPDILRNALSQTLSRQDRMFIIDSHSAKTAWFNIGADLDHRVRALWDDESGV